MPKHYSSFKLNKYFDINLDQMSHTKNVCKFIQDTFFNETVRPHIDSVNKAASKIMVMVGDDFDFDLPSAMKGSGHPVPVWDTRDKETTFSKLETVLTLLNSTCPDPRYRIKMATPHEYLSSLNTSDLPTLSTDFSHYDERTILLHPDLSHKDRIDYWTGYFDNLPSLKHLITTAFDTYLIARAFAKQDDPFWHQAAQNISYGTHHDSITGVSKAYVHR